MTEIRINNPIERGFAMVPDVLWAWPGLSFRAKGFMAFLLSFRGGSIPPVRVLEVMTGLHRDARRACMAELDKAGLAEWKVQRDQAGRVVAKYLLVDTAPLLRAVASGEIPDAVDRAPEKPSHGRGSMRLKNRLTVNQGGHARDKRRSSPEITGDIVESDTDKAVPPPAPQSAKAAASAVGGSVGNPREAGPVGNSTGTGSRVEASQDAENGPLDADRTALDGWDRAAVEALRGGRPAYVAGRWIEIADSAWRDAHMALVFADMAAKRARCLSS